jgi:hypothetical protein
MRAPPLLVNHLSQLVHVLVLVMDPASPGVREAFFRLSLSVMFNIVPKFPMVSLGMGNTRVAVGSINGHVDIYDIKSCTLLQVYFILHCFCRPCS